MGWDLGAKWGVNAADLMGRLCALDLVQTVLVVERLEEARADLVPVWRS